MKVFLGSYRIGQTRRKLSEVSVITIEKGPFKGKKINFPNPKLDLNYPSLPPITRHSNSVLDLTPFLLYEEVIMDASSFRALIDSKAPLKGLTVPQTTKSILEGMANKGIVNVVDSIPILENDETNKLLQEITLYDLQDANIIDALKQSIDLWVAFRRDILKRDKSDISRFKHYIELLDKGVYSDSTLNVLFHSMLDVNKTLLLGKKLGAEIYDWEDYSSYYNYKFSRSVEAYKTRDKVEQTRKLFDVFIPNFQINSLEQLIEIRSDSHLDSVRSLVASNELGEIDEDFVQNTRLDVLEINASISGYLRIMEWLVKPVELIPFAGGIAAKAIIDASKKYVKNQLEIGNEWKLFFTDMRKTYNRKDIINLKKKIF